MEKKISVDFTVNEAQVLLQIIDIAVKTQGLSAAEAGFILAKKIQEKFPSGDSISSPNFQPPSSFPKTNV